MSAVIAVAAVVAAVWALVFVLRGSLLAGCLAYLLLASCLGTDFYELDAAGVTLSLDRVFLVVLAAAYVVQRRTGRAARQAVCWADMALAALVVVLGLSALTHNWRQLGPDQVPIVQHLLNGYVLPAALYWIARGSVGEQRGTSLVLKVLCCFGFYLGVTGLAEAAGQWWLVYPKYIADPEVGLHFGRARGPMVHSMRYGLYLAACLVAGLVWGLEAPRRRWYVWLLLIPLLVAAIYLTKTRTVWLGAAAGVLVVSVLAVRGRACVAVLGLALLGGTLVVATQLDSIVGLKREGTVADTRQSVSMRASFAYVSWKMFLDRPILGFGFGQFAAAKQPYLNDRSVPLQLQAIREYGHHNMFLSLLTEVGIVGLALYLALLALWARAGWRLAHSVQARERRSFGLLMLGVLAVAVCQMMGHEISYTPLEHSLIFLVAALGVSLTSSDSLLASLRRASSSARRLPRVSRQLR